MGRLSNLKSSKYLLGKDEKNMEHKLPSPDWYKHIWDLGIKAQSWVESTERQVDFIIEALELTGKEKILDLACGFGRHSLALAKRGYSVTGVDITKAYIEDAARNAECEMLSVAFLCSDLRDLQYDSEFDIVLNLADGAIGYLENEEENNKIFQVIARALKPGGKSLMDICNQEHALVHFPKKHWEIGQNSISLPWFDYDQSTKRMLYGGFEVSLGKLPELPSCLEAHSSVRLYSFTEVTQLFDSLGVDTLSAYGDYNLEVPSDHKHLQMLIISQKRAVKPSSIS
jgi:SAM-dependent methyltransferase